MYKCSRGIYHHGPPRRVGLELGITRSQVPHPNHSAKPRCLPKGSNLIFWNNQTSEWIDWWVNDILLLQMLQCGGSLDCESTKSLHRTVHTGFMEVTVLCKLHNLITRRKTIPSFKVQQTKWISILIKLEKWLEILIAVNH